MRATAKEIEALAPVGFWGRVRRAFGLFTREEKSELRYLRMVHHLASRIAKGQEFLGARPGWLKMEDYKHLRALQKKVERTRAR
uniref:Uncharacterized protein n=1 Tax=Siphoviridae sp. ct3b712 TaxID=2826283 RepID=A0A8S5M3Z3_9CAUD|nr:MAG TPA: hypothetical protein [Siphoviridae sp. ct3b712]